LVCRDLIPKGNCPAGGLGDHPVTRLSLGIVSPARAEIIFTPRIAGIGRDWAGVSAPSGVTEHENYGGPILFPDMV
jgi:hypothetical protein